MKTFFYRLTALLPHHFISRCMGRLATISWPPLKNSLIRLFIKIYRVDMQEALFENPDEYKTFQDFFTRALKSDQRSVDTHSKSITSPVDGYISQWGSLQKETLLQAKGLTFSLNDLFSNFHPHAAGFYGGQFITFYLAPHNYHRVHMPIDGQLTHMFYVPGRLFSVAMDYQCHLPNLFVRNERVIALFNTPIGKMAVIFIGATNVGGIHTAWHGQVTPRPEKNEWTYEKKITLNKGDEMGHFAIGSSVMLLFPPKSLTWENEVQWNQAVQWGTTFAKWCGH